MSRRRQQTASWTGQSASRRRPARTGTSRCRPNWRPNSAPGCGRRESRRARWSNLQNQATRPDIATLIDDAILAVERDNLNLKGKLPRDYARRGIEAVKMKSLIDLIAGIGFKGSHGKARDTLGRVYEYFLGKFAAAEGKLGGEFYTPRSVVRVLVEMLEPYEGRIYDPACGSGGMFFQSEKLRHFRPQAPTTERWFRLALPKRSKLENWRAIVIGAQKSGPWKAHRRDALRRSRGDSHRTHRLVEVVGALRAAPRSPIEQ